MLDIIIEKKFKAYTNMHVHIHSLTGVIKSSVCHVKRLENIVFHISFKCSKSIVMMNNTTSQQSICQIATIK